MEVTSREARGRPKGPQALALFIIGLGLLALGAAGLILLPKAGGQPGSGSSGSALPAKVDFAAPDLSLTDLDGEAVSLSDYRGQVVLVNNWATWCPPCREEMPALQGYYRTHRENGFAVIAIEAGEPAGEVVRFVSEYGLTFPVWLDPRQEALAAFRNLSLPSSYVIDRQGRVRLAWSGAISLGTLEKYVTPMIKE